MVPFVLRQGPKTVGVVLHRVGIFIVFVLNTVRVSDPQRKTLYLNVGQVTLLDTNLAHRSPAYQ